jgi:hypothetical protein
MRWGIIFLLLVFSASLRSAEENKWNTVGIRAGFTDQSSEKYFSKYQAYVSFGLPLEMAFPSGLDFRHIHPDQRGFGGQ